MRLLLLAMTALTLSCSDGPPPMVETVNDISCGAVADGPGKPAEQLGALTRLRQWFQMQPQIVVWTPATWQSTEIRVAFLDGDATSHAFVMSVAREWLPGLNLKFSESSAPDSEVRVTFAGNGVWSKIGRMAQSVPAGKPTMGLGGLLQSADPDRRRAYVLHEFGHALGALHEHQRPDVPLTWKKDVVYAYYLQTYGWSQSQVDAEVILPFQQSNVTSSEKFDRLSVMMYPVLKEFTQEGFVQSWNSKLTEWDRTIMADRYK